MAPLGGEGGVVADAGALLDALALHHFGLDPGDLADMPRRLAPRHAAIEGETGASEVEGVIGAEADAGAVGEAQPLRRHPLRQVDEDIALGGIHRHVLVGAGEVAHQRLDLEPVEQAGLDVRRHDSKPVDAGVDHDVARPAGAPPTADLLRRAQYRPGVRAERRLHVLGSHAVQHRHFEVARPRGQRRRLVPGGDEEVAAAGMLQPLDRLARADPVSVGLDRGAASGAAAAMG